MTREADMAMPSSNRRAPTARIQQGASLMVVLILLIVVSLLGVGSIQIATMGERSARNDRDQQIAWQAAEAGLMDAELDIDPNGMGTGSRRSTFAPTTDASAFVLNCENPSGMPAWLTVDFLSTSTPNTAGWGDFSNRGANTYPTGGGLKSYQAPRYVIEAIKDPAEVQTKGIVESRYVFRVTAMGFGPRQDIQAVMQMIYRD